MIARPGGTAASRLFTVSFAALIATSFGFVLRALVIDDWGREFALSETQKGELLGVGLWPFAISIVLLSLIIDRVGFKLTLWFAAICHATGLAVLVTADGYWPLYAGTFVMALGNGAVEAAINPLVATLHPDNKPKWLNRLHAGWPGGLVLGGLIALGLGADADWRVKIALTALPLLIYAIMLIGARFPVSERVALGVSYRAMLGEAGWLSALVIAALMLMEVGRVFAWSGTAIVASIAAATAAYAFYARSAGRPLFVVFMLLMIPLAITELGTDGWIASLMEPQMRALGLQAGWVLVYTAMIVFVMRLVAGPILRAFTPLGVLAMASAATAAGLFLLSSATGPMLLAAATLYGIGKSFFWGTSLGVVGEQFPRGGAVALNVIAGAGMLAAGVVGSVLLGYLQDQATARGLAEHDAATRSAYAATYLGPERGSVLGGYRALDPARLAAAPAAERAEVEAITTRAKQSALRDVALLPAFMLVAYLALIMWFRARGGYRPVLLGAGATG